MSWDIQYLLWRHFGRHLEKLYLQAIATKRDWFPDLDIMEIDSSFVFLGDLWAVYVEFGAHISATFISANTTRRFQTQRLLKLSNYRLW